MIGIIQTVTPPSRRGAVTLEAIVGLPILVIVLMAGFEYGMIALSHQAAMSAVTEAAREGAKVPTTVGAADGGRVLDAVELAVEDVLGTHGLTVDANSGVQLVIEDSSGVGSRGQAITAVPTISGVTDSQEVRVTIRVQFDNARVPNLLGTFGVDLSAKQFEMYSVSRRDGP
jgi:Flp pilus assembly protein TadG